MVMEEKTIALPRRLSNESVTSLDLRNKKKRLFSMFHSKKSDNSVKSSGSFISYFRSRKQLTQASDSKKIDRATPDRGLLQSNSLPDGDMSRGKASKVFNTWSVRRSSKLDLCQAKDGKSDISTSVYAGEIAPTFVDVFAHAASDVKLKPPASSGLRNSIISESDFIDETGCTEQLTVSSYSSITPRTSNFPHSSSSVEPVLVGETSLLSRLKQKRRSIEDKADAFSGITSLFLPQAWMKGRKKMLRSVEEEVFDTWDGRRASTLPRQIRKGKLLMGITSTVLLYLCSV